MITLIKIALSQVVFFFRSPIFYFHDGKGNKWSRLDALLVLILISMLLLWFFYAMHIVFDSLNPR